MLGKTQKIKLWLMIILAAGSISAVLCLLPDLRGYLSEYLLLVIASMLVGISLGQSGCMKTLGAKRSSPHQAKLTAPAGRQNDRRDSDSSYLDETLDELTLLQNSADILERYQFFIRVVEKSLHHALGGCAVSLWCPEHNYRRLVECVIHPSGGSNSFVCSWSSGSAAGRNPCRIPLDSPLILNALKTGEPFLSASSDGAALSTEQAEVSLRSDACIPLYREYGQPLLINVQRTGRNERIVKGEAFPAAVRLIRLFWKQLQAANQRQWLAEHDPTSRALRDEVFLRQAQEWAFALKQRDELFALVVITVQGFRSMFAGGSDRWRCLSGLLGRCLLRMISAQQEKFLLGKMADDVFALLLVDKDVFLADALMRIVAAKLGPEMKQSPALSTLDILAVDVQWSIDDHRHYQGDVERLLNKIYRRLFARGQNKHRDICRIVLAESNSEVVLPKWT